MGKESLQEGGLYKFKKTGEDKYTMQVPIDPDDYEMIARECPCEDCSPGYFKVKPGTGITENQTIAFCPYCKNTSEPDSFISNEQHRYAIDVFKEEVLTNEIQNMVTSAFGLGPSGKKKCGNGFIEFEISYKPSKPQPVKEPNEEELLRIVTCPQCGLDHAVFGLATWCPDCGKDIFMTHVKEELSAVQIMLENIEHRKNELGSRIEAKTRENCLEDMVSIFEAVLKIITKKHLKEKGLLEEEIQEIIKRKIGNRYQNPLFAEDVIRNLMHEELYEIILDVEKSFLREIFEKRHPITHNLGVIDKKYVEKTISSDKEGKEIRITKNEIEKTIQICLKIFENLYNKLSSNEFEQI